MTRCCLWTVKSSPADRRCNRSQKNGRLQILAATSIKPPRLSNSNQQSLPQGRFHRCSTIIPGFRSDLRRSVWVTSTNPITLAPPPRCAKMPASCDVRAFSSLLLCRTHPGRRHRKIHFRALRHSRGDRGFPPFPRLGGDRAVAAWSSMAADDGFEVRPVAGIAAGSSFGHGEAGDVLELEATLVKADREAVGYDGLAKVKARRWCVSSTPSVRWCRWSISMTPRRCGPATTSSPRPGRSLSPSAAFPAMGTEKTGGTPGESAEGILRCAGTRGLFR